MVRATKEEAELPHTVVSLDNVVSSSSHVQHFWQDRGERLTTVSDSSYHLSVLPEQFVLLQEYTQTYRSSWAGDRLS